MANFFQDVIMTDPRFHSTQPISDPSLLEPHTRASVQAMIADAAAHGVALMIFETYRSQERRAMLYTQRVPITASMLIDLPPLLCAQLWCNNNFGEGYQASERS